MKNQLKILIGYSSRFFSDGLKSMIAGSEKYTIIDTVNVWLSLLNRVKTIGKVDIVIIELCMPRRHDIDHIQNLFTKYPHIKIFLISHLPHYKISKELLENGLSAYLLKTCNRQDLFMALSKLSINSSYICTDITVSIMKSEKKPINEVDIKLTEREKEILGELVKGKTNLHISRNLKLSENTVKSHRRNIQNKFGVNNVLGMVRYACRANLVDFGKDEYCLECPHCILD